MKQIVLASSNLGKAKEFNAILNPIGYDIVLQKDLGVKSPIEDGKSFVENAMIKARYASEQTNLPALADDSGICVDILGGAPGIYSARYASEKATDEQNNHKLLEVLSPYKELAQRKASYWCALVFLKHKEDPTPIIVTASWEGYIGFEPRGNGGFGYDPLFEIKGRNLTVAQLPAQIKNLISHRARAIQKLLIELDFLNNE